MIVSIVGKPNVGKSSLFNLLIGKNKSIISPIAGTTRDRIADWASIKDRNFLLIDTGGLNNEDYLLSNEINAQANLAIKLSDIVILLLDSSAPVSDFDITMFKAIAKLKKKYLIAVNKIDVKNENLMYEFLRFKDAIFISTKQNKINELKEKLYSLINKSHDLPAFQTKIAIVGRTNVGKSSLFNAIINDNRSIVSNEAGTTRDSIDTFLTYEERTYRLTDTAGLRLRLKKEGLDKLSSIFSVFSIERCDIALLVIDAKEGITSQDLKIANFLQQQHKGIIVILNKWDLIEKEPEQVYKQLKNRLNFIHFAPFLRLSAKEAKNTNKIFKNIQIVEEFYNLKVETHKLNNALLQLSKMHHGINVQSKPIKLKYINQIETRPPTFVVFTNVEKTPPTYENFIKNHIYKLFKFIGCPIKLIFKQS